jgi:hypothetical protein
VKSEKIVAAIKNSQFSILNSQLKTVPLRHETEINGYELRRNACCQKRGKAEQDVSPYR